MCLICNWEQWLDTIKEILTTRHDLPASGIDFLENVETWVESNKHVTDKQIEGIRTWQR